MADLVETVQRRMRCLPNDYDLALFERCLERMDELTEALRPFAAICSSSWGSGTHIRVYPFKIEDLRRAREAYAKISTLPSGKNTPSDSTNEGSSDRAVSGGES